MPESASHRVRRIPIGTESDLIARAEALVPVLRQRADATDRARVPSQDTRHDLKRLGLPQMFQPARYGGAEGSFRAGVDMLRAVGRGCGSTAWILVQHITHNMLIASWPEAAQDALWGETPDALVSGILIPGVGKASPCAGGYRLSGRWPFVSGVDISDWLMFTADTPNDDGGSDDRHFLVPRAAATIIDTWHTIGLRGSASNDVVLEDVFVPDYMTVTMQELKGENRGPGHAVNRAPIFQIPPYSLFGTYIGSAALGIAEAAVEYYLASARGRRATMSGVGVAHYTTQQVKVAEARSAVLAATTILHATCDEAQELVDRRQPTTVEDRTRFRSLAAYAGKLSTAAVNLVLDAAGGAGIYERNPLSRCAADMIVANRHTTQNWDVNASAYGRVLFGLPVGIAALDD